MKLFRSLLSLILLGGVLLPAVPVHADGTITVNTNADESPPNQSDGLCSLREAITNANDNAATYPNCTAGSGADTITFAGDYTITLVDQLPTITTVITINGKGAEKTTIQASTCNPITLLGNCTPATYRVFWVHEGVLTLDGVSVRNGHCDGQFCDGGGIFVEGGNLTVIDSTFSGNSATGAGGGIFVVPIFPPEYTPTVSIYRSTFAGNSANEGGGIGTFLSRPKIVNSTFSGNSATGAGGGIFVLDKSGAIVTNSTFSGNSANEGGGIFVDQAGLTLTNTIVANSPSGGNCVGGIINGGNNLESGTSCQWGTNRGSFSNIDPKLGLLADNGGPTQTHALLDGSPAINTGKATACSNSDVQGVDQRGVARPQGIRCDIGAFEKENAPMSTFADVPAGYWAQDFIERMYSAGITGGCSTSPFKYCPENIVTRAQMAVFLLRGIHGSSFAPPPEEFSTGFTDVPLTYWAAFWIKQLAAEGITSGCGNGNYCPENGVTRAQMAVFLLRAKHGSTYVPPAVGSDTSFSDVPASYWSAAWIKQLVAEGITSGCGTGTYCPEAPVTRAQMAVFLVRTFSLP